MNCPKPSGPTNVDGAREPGEISVVVNTEPLHLLMAPSGVDKGMLNADDLIVVNKRLR